MQIVRNKDVQIENLNEKMTQMLKEKEKLMREYNNDLKLRENEMESMKIAFDEELAKKEREKS